MCKHLLEAVMEHNCSVAPPPDWLVSVGSAAGVTTGTLVALLSAFASVGFVSLLAVLPYLARLCGGRDIITECLVGRSVVTFSIDATGNGLHAAKKLVLDANTGKLQLRESGLEDSPPPAACTTSESTAK